MGDFKEDYLLSRQEYGPLYPYVADDGVRMIFWNGRNLMIGKGNGEVCVGKERLTEGFLNRFAMLVSNRCAKPFGSEHPLFICNRDDFYLELIHRESTRGGIVLSFIKHDRPSRPDVKELLEKGFCTEEVIPILKGVIQKEESFLLYGPGRSGKKSLLRFMSRYIPTESRVVSLEIDDRLALAPLNPDKDVTELNVQSRREYKEASQLFQMCPGLEPRWVFSLINEGRLVNEWVRIMDGRSIRGGMLVRILEWEDVTERLFPWMDERSLGKMRNTLVRVFPVWIELDREGLKSIVRYDRTKKETLYERNR